MVCRYSSRAAVNAARTVLDSTVLISLIPPGSGLWYSDLLVGKMSRERHTAGRILDVAERLVQSRGFNGFSYADVAAELGVTKASLHYHFPGKAELGEALINRYAGRFGEALQTIDLDGGDVHARLEAYAALYASVLREQRMCLCGMLAADYET